jgi:fluoride ion exporter CrcB/FEX
MSFLFVALGGALGAVARYGDKFADAIQKILNFSLID